MTVFEVLLLGVALSMDACAVGMTNGMAERDMRTGKAILIAFFFGAFQGLMPLLGYWGGSVFSSLIAAVAPWVSFALLVLIGGKMIADCVRERRERRLTVHARTGLGRLFMQAIATSIDALAVGISLLAQELSGGLPFGVPVCALVIAVTTFFLTLVAVQLGKLIGSRFSDSAEMLGGMVLVVIGAKLLFEGIL